MDKEERNAATRRALIAEQVRRQVGSPGKQSPDNPYQPDMYADDLVKNMGVFYVTVKENDPRLTVKGIDLLAGRLRKAAFDWLLEQVKEDETRIVCENPVIKVVSHDTPTGDYPDRRWWLSPPGRTALHRH
jgi:hypothetical protein